MTDSLPVQVREALQHIPGRYEDFLQVIYEFESSTQRQTAVDLYKSLKILLQDWPQLLKDFAAFLLPEQALACGLVSRWAETAQWDSWVRARLDLNRELVNTVPVAQLLPVR